MVSRTVLATLLLLCTPGMQAAELKIDLVKKTQVYGEAVEVLLTANDADAPLARIDLQPWSSSFHIGEPEVLPVEKRTRQRLRVQLYPRSAGKLTLAPLTLGELHTARREIEVRNASSITAPEPIRIRQEWSATSVLQRQAVRHRFILESSDAFAELAAGDVADERWQITQSTEYRIAIRKNGRTRYRYTLNRFYFPQIAGKQAIQAAPVEYQVNGRTRYQFANPVNRIQVTPLPRYLPPFMPVGTLHIQSRIETGQAQWRPLKTDHLYYWHIRIQGIDLSPGTLPGVLSQIRSNRSLSFLPAETRRQHRIENGHWVEMIHYQVPFTLKSSGLVTLPGFKLQYLDSATGRIASQEHEGLRLFALAYWIQLAVLALLLALIIAVSVRLYPAVRILLHRHRVLREICQRLRETTRPQDMRELLRRIAVLYHWNPNVTLEEWLRQWNRVSRGRAPLDLAVRKLSAMLYGKQMEDVLEIRTHLLQGLYKAPLLSR